MEQYLMGLMKHLEQVAENQKILAENQEKLARALEQMAENQSKMAKAQEAMIETQTRPNMDEILMTLADSMNKS